MANLEYGIFEDAVFRIKYPLGWENATRLWRLHGVRELIFSYSDVPRRKGFIGKVADIISREPQGGVSALKLSLEPFKKVADQSQVDEILFKSLRKCIKSPINQV